jgi:ubiquinone/menaquinone biosynthesis C-methylase UbiE
MATATFDPDAYKRTTHDQWQQVADAWDRWSPTLERWLGPATELMLDLAGIGHGARVLDVAAGSGGQTFAAARRVGATGSVLATDISANILAHAARHARDAGLTQVATRVMDGESLAVEPGFYDAVISRVGLIYFPDQAGAVAGMRAALRPGGRLAVISYSTPDRNGFFSVPVGIIRRRAELPAPLPGQPGPFSLGAPGAIEALLADFTDVTVHRVDAPLRLASAAECVRFEQESFGALHQMLSGLDNAGRAAAWAEIESELSAFEGTDGFVGPCELIVAAGTRP